MHSAASGGATTVDQFLKQLGSTLRAQLHIPPIVIASGFSVRASVKRAEGFARLPRDQPSSSGASSVQGYLAQKYLESYPAAAFVLLSSMGPNPGALLRDGAASETCLSADSIMQSCDLVRRTHRR